MRLVTAPLQFLPHVCFYTGRDDGELVDFERDIICLDPHLYLKPGIVEEAGELVGMLKRRAAEELKAELKTATEERDHLKGELDAVRSFVDAIKEFTVLQAAPDAPPAPEVLPAPKRPPGQQDPDFTHGEF